MFSVVYRNSEKTSVYEEVMKFDNDIQQIKVAGEKGFYTCPFCGSKLRFRAGKKYEKHFAHWSGQSCFEAQEQENEVKRYNNQIKRESKKHKVIRDFIFDELYTQKKINKDIEVYYGVEKKAYEKWKYYPDILLVNRGEETAISILTNVTHIKDQRLISGIQKRNRFYNEKGLNTMWFVEERQQSINMVNHVIHLWESEVDLANETKEDKVWTQFLKDLRNKNDVSIFKVFGYEPQHTLDDRVKSIYYVNSIDDKIIFTVNRFILDGREEPFNGFALNKGYQISLSQALLVSDQMRLSDPETENLLRVDFEKEYNQLKSKYLLEEERKRRVEEEEKARLEAERKRIEEEREKKKREETLKLKVLQEQREKQKEQIRLEKIEKEREAQRDPKEKMMEAMDLIKKNENIIKDKGQMASRQKIQEMYENYLNGNEAIYDSFRVELRNMTYIADVNITI